MLYIHIRVIFKNTCTCRAVVHCLWGWDEPESYRPCNDSTIFLLTIRVLCYDIFIPTPQDMHITIRTAGHLDFMMIMLLYPLYMHITIRMVGHLAIYKALHAINFTMSLSLLPLIITCQNYYTTEFFLCITRKLFYW